MTMAKEFTYSDFDSKLAVSSGGQLKVITDADCINQSIKTILSTKKGERLMLPEFGSGLFEYLFAPIDEFTGVRLSSDISESLATWEDRITVNGVNVLADPDTGVIDISIDYRILKTSQQGNFTARVITDNIG